MPDYFSIEDRRGPYAPNCGWCFDAGCTFCEGTIATRLRRRIGHEEYDKLEAEADAFIVKHLSTGENGNVVEIAIPQSRQEWLAFVIAAFKHGEERVQTGEPSIGVST